VKTDCPSFCLSRGTHRSAVVPTGTSWWLVLTALVRMSAVTVVLSLTGGCSWPNYTSVEGWAGEARFTVDYPIIVEECTSPAQSGRGDGVRALQQVLSLYLSAIETLAADGVLPYQEDPFAKLTPRLASLNRASASASALGALLRKSTISNARAPELGATIVRADEHVQVLVGVLAATVTEMAFAEAPVRMTTAEAYQALERRSHDPAVQYAIRGVAGSVDRGFAAWQSAHKIYVQAINQVADGHALLRRRAARLSQQETSRQVRTSLDALHRTGALLPRSIGSAGMTCPVMLATKPKPEPKRPLTSDGLRP
jgi:hypothetical protein